MQWIFLLIILCVIAYFIPDRKDKNVEDRIYTIPDGDEKIQVLGSEYRPARRNYKQLREEHGDTFMIAFAPPSDYQLARGWPREPFLNVVRVGERLSRKDNWMGYVTPEAGIDIPAIYDHHRGLIRAVAVLEGRKRSPDMYIKCSKDMGARIYIQHDEKQVSALDKLSRKYNRISVVFVKNESESGIYEACAGKHSLGTVKATARIEKIVGDGSYKAQILLRYWNESGHNKHYSAVDVFKL
nr:MAG TPA: hypothetical protein [Caudoviricetes sp.]